jgi:hypothetical protein
VTLTLPGHLEAGHMREDGLTLLAECHLRGWTDTWTTDLDGGDQ